VADLADLQNRLRSDPKLQQEFLSDPAGVLQREGLTLSPQAEKDLRDLVTQLQGPKPAVPGASVKSTTAAPARTQRLDNEL
jgi:hypothetical protein